MSEVGFEGKVVLVTGSGQGIGRAAALEFSRRGAKVLVNDLGSSMEGHGTSSAPGEETVRLIKEAGGEAALSLDSVAGWDSAYRIVEAALDNFGRLDVVVNNAGNLRWQPFWEATEDDFRSIVDVHLGGCFFVSRAAAPYFMKQKSGAYVHLTSTSGIIGHYNQTPYCAAKAGVAGLSKAIALEMKQFNVRSNCVAPFAASRMSQTSSTAKDPKLMAVLDKLKPEQNGRLIVALASDAAAGVSGQIFICRGNEIMLARPGLPVRGMQDSREWSVDTIISNVFPAMGIDFAPLASTNEYINWPVS